MSDVLLVLRRMWVQITSDRRRFGVLCAMLLVGLLLWARIIVTSNVPQTAVAGERGASGSGVGSGGHGGGDESDKRKRPVSRVELARLPVRDPLAISADQFPKPTPVTGLTPDPAKSGGDPTENPKQAEARLYEELRALVDRFELEAVMQGRPMAVLNGRTYRLGDWVPAIGNDQIQFELVDVGHRSVVLQFENRDFVLKMKFPGNQKR